MTTARNQLATAGHGVVRVFGDDEELARHLNLAALNDPDAGRVAILARPQARRRSWVGNDLLAALGIRHDVTGVEKDEQGDWLLAQIWLTAHRVEHLVVAHTEWLPAPIIRELLLLAAGAGVTTWLLTTPPRSDTQVRMLAEWTDLEVDWTTFLTAFADLPHLLHGRAVEPAPTPELETASDETMPPAWLPDDDFPTFRAACRDRLVPAAGSWADTAFLAALRDATSWVASHSGPDVPAVAARLHGIYDTCATVAEFLVATRATQVALFRGGWLCQVDLARLAALAETVPRRAQRSPQLWRRARVYRQPHRAVVAALAGAGLDLIEMNALTVADVSPDGTTVTVTGTTRHIEPGAEVLVRAMLLLRTHHGAGPDEQLLASPTARPLQDRTLADLLNRMRLETGLAVTGRPVARSRGDARQWYVRWGVNVARITEATP